MDVLTVDCFVQNLVDQIVTGKDESSNIFISPSSIKALLRLLELCSKGNTKEQIKRILPTKKRFCLNSFETKTENIFEFNGLFLDFSFPLNELTISKIKEKVHIVVKGLNFQNFPEKSRKKINEIVERLTECKVKNMLKQNTVNKDTSMIICNVLYFNCDWKTPFNTLLTKKTKFTCLCGKKSTIDMMGLKQKFFVNHNEDLEVRCIQIPFKYNRFTMVVFLPENNEKFESIVKKLTAKEMEKLITKSVEKQVLLKLPKFKLNYELDDLSKVIKKLGATDMFCFKKANFKKISHADELFVSKIVHTSYIEINELGAEAASCTAAIATFSGPYVPTPTFECDRPFVFIIRNNINKEILFYGKVISL